MLQIGTTLFYYKLGKTLLRIGAASLLQIGASAVTYWGSHYKLGQPLLQNRATVTNWGEMHHKLRQVLQIRAIVTNWGIKATFLPTNLSSRPDSAQRQYCRSNTTPRGVAFC